MALNSPTPPSPASLSNGQHVDAPNQATLDSSISNPSASGALLNCTSCGGANPVDSRFCRLCGSTLEAEKPNLASNNAVPVAAVNPAQSEIAPSANGLEETESRRARQLLDRAFALAERGDMAGAILACRQSVALAPDAAQGFSMLGLLLERGGDLEQAAAAYSRALRLSPDSRLEQESLARLQATLANRPGDATHFRFDEGELFAPVAASSSPVSGSPASSVAAVSAGVIASGAVPASVSTSGQSTPFDATLDVSKKSPVSMPLIATSTLVISPSLAASVGTANNSSMNVNAPSVGALNFDLPPETSAPLWSRLANNPTFFFRGVPLAAATALGVMFLVWARGSAVSRETRAGSLAPIVIDSNNSVPVANDAGATNNPSAGVTDAAGGQTVMSPPGAVGGAGPGQPYPVTNGAATGQNLAPNSTNLTAPGRNVAAPAVRPSTGNVASGNSGNENPPRATSSPRVAPAFPSAQRVAPAVPRMLPPVRVNVAPIAPQTVPAMPYNPPANDASGIASSGGSPLNPAGNGNRNYINLNRPRTAPVAPPRPVNRANESERAAARDGRAGRNDNAIGNITAAIQGGETGYRYQQRALLFLERGDNQRAADDFQTAISAYRDQIRKGENASEAQAGITACQSGLRLALANLRR